MDNFNKPKNLTKIGKQSVSVKLPKAKKMPDAFSPPSIFFKSEENVPKHKNLKMLYNFLQRKHKI